jgi:hypothetical protein
LRPNSSLSRRACLASANFLNCCFHLLSLPMVATIVCKLDVDEDEVVWACACLCTGPPKGAKAAPLHNPNPTSPSPNSKNSSDLCWNFWPKFGRQTFLHVAFRCHALYKFWPFSNPWTLKLACNIFNGT